jgi:uncharacterized protein
MKSKPLILTHANCTDGCTCAAILHRKYGNQAVYIAVDHADLDSIRFPDRYQQFRDATDCISKSEIIMADLCLSRDLIDRFLGRDNHITILDHHASSKPVINYYRKRLAKEELPLAIHFSDDNDKCGAMLTWEYVYDSPAPLFVRMVSDMDRWAFEYGDESKYLYAGLNAELRQPKDISAQEYESLIFNDFKTRELIEIGKPLHHLFMDEIQTYAHLARPVRLGDYVGLWVEAPGHFKSDLGNALALKSQTFGAVVTRKIDMVQVSLRSVAPFNVSDLAALHGGAGHPQAAAFRLTAYKDWLAIANISIKN